MTCSKIRILRYGGRKIEEALLLVFAVILMCAPAFSQANTGRILGNVTDQTGGAIVGATVTVTDTERGTSRTLTTDESGAYNAPSLIPSTYTVRGEFKGFKSTERQNIVLEVGKEARVDLELQPGEQTEKITVTEALPLVETTNAVLGGTLQPGTIADLPLNGRNFMKLLDLRPGVTTFIGGGAWTQSTNGLRPEHNVYILDGITGMEPLGGQSTINSVSLAGDAASLLPIDTIQEFNVQQNPKAEFGWKPGAITNIALKSGTNAWHGTANAFGRSDKLDARNPFLTGTNPDGSTQKQRIGLEEFGATFGGPVRKDKMFFFLAYEGQRYNVGNPNAFTFPSLTPGAGAKNSLVDACLADKTAGTPLSATSLTVSGLDTNCARTTGYSIFALDPNSFLRDTTSAATSINVSASLDTNYSVDDGLAKFDFQLNDKNTLNAKYFIGGHRGLVVNNQTISQPFWRPDDQAYTQFAGAQCVRHTGADPNSATRRIRSTLLRAQHSRQEKFAAADAHAPFRSGPREDSSIMVTDPSLRHLPGDLSGGSGRRRDLGKQRQTYAVIPCTFHAGSQPRRLRSCLLPPRRCRSRRRRARSSDSPATIRAARSW